MSSKLSLVLFSLTLCIHIAIAQQTTDTVTQQKSTIDLNWKHDSNLKPFPAKQLVVPALMIGYGFTAINNNGLKNLNKEFKEELVLENPHKQFHLDNYLQYAPAVAVYGLNAAGIKGGHNFTDRSMIYLLSNLFVGASVSAIKKYSHQLRPDGSGYTSFPSGHTSEAFASAEFLRLEYKDVSPWYGIAGYAAAATTGYLRMYNNRHWLSDIVAGAGVGIASTKLSYWLYPRIKQLILKNKMFNTALMPTYQNRAFGFALVHHFSK